MSCINEEKLEFTNKILDDVHGMIYLTKYEYELINTPLFQRLRNLKQLGITNQVFPGTQHNRFSHSLGVMYIADRICVKLSKYISLKERKIMRLAGLLHDIGHYPLSHIGELSYKNYDYINVNMFESQNSFLLGNNSMVKKRIFKDDQVEKIISKGKDRGVEYHHETISNEMVRNNSCIREIIRHAMDCSTEDELKYIIRKIANIINGSGLDVSKEKYEKGDYKIALLTQIMHSELDADRLDYLIRDSKASGKSFGILNLDYLISNFNVFEWKEEKYKETNEEYPLIFCVNESAITAADQFLIDRFYSYTDIVFHDKVLFLNKMAEYLIQYGIYESQQSNENKEKEVEISDFPSLKELKQWSQVKQVERCKEFRMFDDHLYWQLLNRLNTSTKVETIITSITNKILSNQGIDCSHDDEVSVIALDKKDFQEAVKQSKILEDESSRFFLYYKNVLTATLSEEKFEKKLYEEFKEADLSVEEIEIRKNKYRLIKAFEGVAILCNNNGNPKVKMLVDCKKSIIHLLSNLTMHCVRSYNL